MYFLDREQDAPAKLYAAPLPAGLWRVADEHYLKRGQQPPTNRQFHLAAKIRVRADRRLKRSTPQWILDWANHPSFDPRNS